MNKYKSIKKIAKKKNNKKIKYSIKNKSVRRNRTKFLVISPINIRAAKKPRKKRKLTSPTSPLMYFTDDTEKAVVEYNTTLDAALKDKIYTEKIHYPFSKLVENIFNTFKFSYFETSSFDVQKECLSHLVANLHKFDPNRKSKMHPLRRAKAYSYFSIVAKHFLILLNNNNHKKFNQNISIGEDHEERTVQLQQIDKHHSQKEMNDFMRLMVEYFENNIEKIFPKSKDSNIANAIIELLRQSDKIDIFNKKTLYLYIREISNCKTQHITKILTKMKTHYKVISNDYKNSGIIETE